MAESLGDRIKEARKSLGLTQQALADRSGITMMTISRYERGTRKRPDAEVVEALAQTLGVSVAWLMRGATGDDVLAPAPLGLAEFLSSGEGKSTTDQELEALHGMGRSVARAGFEPTPQAYAAWLAMLRMLPH